MLTNTKIGGRMNIIHALTRAGGNLELATPDQLDASLKYMALAMTCGFDAGLSESEIKIGQNMGRVLAREAAL